MRFCRQPIKDSTMQDQGKYLNLFAVELFLEVMSDAAKLCEDKRLFSTGCAKNVSIFVGHDKWYTGPTLAFGELILGQNPK